MQLLQKARFATGLFFLVNGAVVGSWVPFIPERAHALGMSAGRLGAVLLGAGVGAVLAMPLAGTLIAHFGSRALSTLCGALFASVFFLNVLMPTQWALFLLLVLSGMFGASMDVAMNAQAVLVEARSGRRILSSMHGLFSLGNVLGSFGVSAAFAMHIPHRMLAASIALLLVAAVLLSCPWMLGGDAVRTSAKRSRRRRFAPQLLLLGALVIAAMIAEGGTGDWSGLYMRNARGLGPGWAGVGFGIFASLMLFGRLGGDSITAKFGEVRTLRFGGFLAAAGALLIVFGPDTSAALLGFALFGAGLSNASPVLYRAAGQMPGIPAGVGLATAVGLGYAGLLAGPPMLGGFGQAFGLPSIFLVMAGLCAALGASATVVRRSTASTLAL